MRLHAPHFGQVTLHVVPKGHPETSLPLAKAVATGAFEVTLDVDRYDPGRFVINHQVIPTDERAERRIRAFEAVADEYVRTYEQTSASEVTLSGRYNQRANQVWSALYDEECDDIADEAALREAHAIDPELQDLRQALRDAKERKREARHAAGQAMARLLPGLTQALLAGVPGGDNHKLQAALGRLAQKAGQGRLRFITKDGEKAGISLHRGN